MIKKNLDKIIKYKLFELNNKYDISLIEIQKPNKGKISKIIKFNYKPHNTSIKENKCMTFYSKRSLVSWLICLE